jgi:hypothetical protein
MISAQRMLQDAYGTASENEPGEVDWWKGMEISIDGEAINVYPIGTQYWTWSIVSEE